MPTPKLKWAPVQGLPSGQNYVAKPVRKGITAGLRPGVWEGQHLLGVNTLISGPSKNPNSNKTFFLHYDANATKFSLRGCVERAVCNVGIRKTEYSTVDDEPSGMWKRATVVQLAANKGAEACIYLRRYVHDFTFRESCAERH